MFEFVVNLLARQNTTQKVTGAGFKGKGQRLKEKAELSYLRSQLREELGIKVGVKTGEIGKWKRDNVVAVMRSYYHILSILFRGFSNKKALKNPRT